MPGSRRAWANQVVGFDPSHRRRTDDRYITIAVGRDYADVTPTSGVFSGAARGALSYTKRTEDIATVAGGRCMSSVGFEPNGTSSAAGYATDGFWDEMFSASGEVRPEYRALARQLAELRPAELERRQRAADASFRTRGITFAVNQDSEGVEKIMPFDLVPRIITAAEWRTIERGLEQRVRALNLFLHDIYHEQHILRDGKVPAELVFGAQGYRPEMRGFDVPLGVYTHVVGTDLVRNDDGQFYVLEDNLRTPSGVS